MKTLSAPAKESREPPSSNDRDELQEPTLQRTPMKLSAQPKRETDNEYENKADGDFRPFSQQPSQPAHHGLEETLFAKDEDTFISNYQSDPKLSRHHTSLEEKQIDLEMLKEKNRNIELRYVMKRVRTYSGLEESSIPMRSQSIKRSKKEEIYHSTDYANFRFFCHQIESDSEGKTPNKRCKEAKRLLAIEEVDSWTTTEWKRTPPKTELPSMIFWIEF